MSQQMAESMVGAPAAMAARQEWDLAAVIDAAPLREAPFDHIRLDNIFPADFYRELLANQPAANQYHPLFHRDAMTAEGSSTRMRMYLYPELLWRLPRAQRQIWGKVAAALMSKELELAFKRKFRSALEDRFQMAAEDIPLYPIPILVRDLPGYHIRVHSDALSKAITVQFYMPSDNSQAHLGTVFHTTRAQDGTDQPTAMQFLPASGYAFAVRKKESWHSAPKTTEADGERCSIMLTYYVDKGHAAKRRLQRLGIFFGKYPKI
ncbi:MAG: hypothetical protein HYU58_08250 [Proteobacteria bacterium]|nr:hypothetical protein [Pseudomonadota bacterium]